MSTKIRKGAGKPKPKRAEPVDEVTDDTAVEDAVDDTAEDVDDAEDALDDTADDDTADDDDLEDEPAKPGRKKPAKTATRGRPKPGSRGRPTGRAGGRGAGGRKFGGKAIAPVKVGKDRPWGLIAMFTTVALIFVAIVGYTAYKSWYDTLTPEQRANRIGGLVDYKKQKPPWLTRDHKPGKLTYQTSPPVGGDHNQDWQDCNGDVYNAPIANEHAVHSLEHGAVWITYRPGLSKKDIDKLASKVKGKDYLLMSPYPGLDKPISLQGWGVQMKADSVGDGRIDEFIKAFRIRAGVEPGAPCSGGITATGDAPRNLPQQQQPGQPG